MAETETRTCTAATGSECWPYTGKACGKPAIGTLIVRNPDPLQNEFEYYCTEHEEVAAHEGGLFPFPKKED
jgi:hypothetical protein